MVQLFNIKWKMCQSLTLSSSGEDSVAMTGELAEQADKHVEGVVLADNVSSTHVLLAGQQEGNVSSAYDQRWVFLDGGGSSI